MGMSEEELRKLTNATNALNDRLTLYKTVHEKGKDKDYEKCLLNAVLEAVDYIGGRKWSGAK